MSALQLSRLAAQDHEAWDRFVRGHEQGSLFHLTAWMTAVSKAFGHEPHYFCAKRDGAICGVLPLFQLKSYLFGNILSSLPFAACGGILAADPETFALLLEAGKGLAVEKDVDYLELKFCQGQDTGLPESAVHFAFCKEISPVHEENFQAIPRKQRRMVRVGIKAGLLARYGREYLPQFYELFAMNVRRLGTPVYSKRWFAALLEVFGEAAEIMVVEYQGLIISGVFSFYYKDTVLPYYAASLPAYRHLAPNDFQYWDLMQHAVERGCRHFDFGRSKKDSGHFHFKKNWGFEPQPLHYQYFLHRSTELPALNPLNPKYKWKIEAWKRLPLSLTKILGPCLVKYIP